MEEAALRPPYCLPSVGVESPQMGKLGDSKIRSTGPRPVNLP